jgi:Fe-S cluster assembly iron-binding protein IscA
MFEITKAAVDHLRKLRREKGLDESMGVRFVGNEGRLGLRFRKSPDKDDRVMAQEGIEIYLAPEVADKFEESIIDARTQGTRRALILRRPKTPRTVRRTSSGRTASPRTA